MGITRRITHVRIANVQMTHMYTIDIHADLTHSFTQINKRVFTSLTCTHIK
jgi:hypothetical protein